MWYVVSCIANETGQAACEDVCRLSAWLKTVARVRTIFACMFVHHATVEQQNSNHPGSALANYRWDARASISRQHIPSRTRPPSSFLVHFAELLPRRPSCATRGSQPYHLAAAGHSLCNKPGDDGCAVYVVACRLCVCSIITTAL